MKINSISYTLFFTALILLSLSCKKKIDEAYTNPNADVRQPVEAILPGIIGNFTGSSSAAGSSYGTCNDGLYIGRYVQYWATNTTGNQYDQMGGATGGSDVLGSIWAMHYYGMGENLNKVILFGTEEKKWDYVGVAYAIRAWSWLTLTDTYGEVILKEAFRPEQLVFKYDTQPEVYDTVRAICRRALSFLNNTGDNASQANLAKGDAFFYNGDVNKWKKFVYATMARSFNHLTNKTDYKPDSVLFYCNLAINSNDDNATAKFSNLGTSGTSNFFGPLRANVGALRQTDFIANLLSGNNLTFNGVTDPRAGYLIRENLNGTFKGIQPNLGSSGLTANDQPRNFWGGSFAVTTSSTDTGRYIFQNGASFPIITAAEVQFMKAEALYRKNDKVGSLAAYTNGINLSIDMIANNYPNNVPASRLITPAAKAAYLANIKVVPSDINQYNLSMIMLQKYIAMYGHGLVETWVDLRRYHYTDQEGTSGRQVYTNFTPPSGLNLFTTNNNKLVYRARPRYNSEYIYNVDELNRIGALALDYNTLEQWFSLK